MIYLQRVRNSLLSFINNSKQIKMETDSLFLHFQMEARRQNLDADYNDFFDLIREFCEKEILIPVKASGSNGRVPKLCRRFRKPSSKDSVPAGFLHALHPDINIQFYLDHPSRVLADREKLIAIDRFLRTKASLEEISLNERSLEIFGDEKLLSSSQGRMLLKRTGLDNRKLNFYFTNEPFFYVDFRNLSKERNILIVENKDTFYSLWRVFREAGSSIKGVEYSLLIYGEGKKIISSLSFANEVLGIPTAFDYHYFGDLDREGVNILSSLITSYPELNISPSATLYAALLESNRLVAYRTHQRLAHNAISIVSHFLDSSIVDTIAKLMEDEFFIPQEALTRSDFMEMCR